MSTLLRAALKKLKATDGSCSSFSVTEFTEDYELTDRVLSTTHRSRTLFGKSLLDGEEVSVKIISKQGLSRATLRRIVNEVKVLRYLRHPNIISVYDIYDRESDITVVSEYLEGQTLADRVLDESFDFTAADCRYVFKTIVSALKYCKGKGVVHRNITPDNIVFSTTNNRKVIKIVDFQWSKQLEKEAMDFSLLETMCGTPSFVAPEVLWLKKYNYKCDVWSLGVIFYLILSGGYLPFASTKRQSVSCMIRKIKQGKWSFQPANVWEEVDEDAVDLVKHMLVVRPGARYTYEQILAHNYFTSPNKSNGERATEITFYSSKAASSIKHSQKTGFSC